MRVKRDATREATGSKPYVKLSAFFNSRGENTYHEIRPFEILSKEHSVVKQRPCVIYTAGLQKSFTSHK